MVRKLTAALLGVGVLVPGLANALGLGEIKLNSHLSEPLDAEIELVQTRELTESEILPGLAAPEDFNAAGVERFHHLTDMKFEVVVNNNGRSYVKVKTRKPIREPFVNFLVEVHWPAGRLLREYTLLLDPPNFSLAAPQPVQPAVTTTAAPTTVSVTSDPAPSTQPAVQAPVASEPTQAAAPSGDGKTYGPTKASDSLWSIARALRPSSDVSIQQTMISIQQLNPDAFINGNINLLKKGKILRGPSTEEARQLSSREAINLVNQQNRAWKDRVSSNRSVADTESAQIDTSGRAVDSFEETVRSDEGRLRLVSAETDAESSSTGQGGTDSEAGGVLRERAELAEETADQFRLENDDLKSKVNELEEQVGTGEKLLDLKDDQIAALQARLAKLEEELQKAKQSGAEVAESSMAAMEPVLEPEAVVEEPEMVEAAEPAVDEAMAEDVSEPVDYNFEEESQPETADAQEAVVETADAEPVQAVQVEATPKKVVVEPPESETPVAPQKEQSLVEQILGNPLYMAIIGGGVAVIAVLGLILGRRRSESEDELDDALVEDFSLNVDDEPATFEEDQPEQDAEPGEETVAQTADVLGEADIYIAYGRFPQAIEMLEKAAEAEPQRSDIRIKLLETSMEAQDQETFMRHYQEVQELGVPSDMDRANALKGQFIGDSDDAADFSSEDSGEDTLVMNTDLGGVEEESSTDFDFNLDDDDDATLVQPATQSEDAYSAPAEAEPETDESEFNLDFDVDAELETETSEPEATTEEVAEDDTSLDFDLDLDAGLDEITSEDVVEADEESLDSEFSLDLAEDDAEDTEVSFGEAEESLDFELAEEDEEAQPETTEDSLEFDLDLDSVDVGDSEATPLDEDDTIVAAPEVAEDSSGEDVIGSMEAAKLADELDLDGDFNLDIDADLASPAEETPDFEVEADLPSDVEDAPVDIEVSADTDVPSVDMEAPAVSVAPVGAEAANGEEELDFLSDADEASTKLDLARAYIDMGDREGAKDILDEVLIEGNDDQQGEAKELLARLD